MYFLLKNATAARGVQLTPANLAYVSVLLSATIGAIVVAQKFSELHLFFLIPLISLVLVLNIPSFPITVQTVIGLLTVGISAWLLFFVLDAAGTSFRIQGMSAESWYKFRAFEVAVPCLCIMLRIVGKNPTRLNVLLFGIPIVVCVALSVYALRILLG